MSSWGVGLWFSKSEFYHDFLKIILKVRCFKNTDVHRPFLKICLKTASAKPPKRAKRAQWRRSRLNDCGRSVDQEPIFLPSGSSESPTHSERRRRGFITFEFCLLFKLLLFLISKTQFVIGLFWSSEFFNVTDGGWWWWMVEKKVLCFCWILEKQKCLQRYFFIWGLA